MDNLTEINRKWFVQLSGDRTVLNTLQSTPSLLDDLLIIRSNDSFYLSSLDFEELKTTKEVRNRSIEIIELINGIVCHLFSFKGEISSNSIIMRNELGGFDRTIFPEPIVINVSLVPPTVVQKNEDGTIYRSSPLLSVENLLKSTKLSQNKAKIFRLLAKKNLDWVMLYRLLEIIESEIGDQIFNWVGKKNIKNFKHTCNSVTVTGDASRHGKEQRQPPKKPMSLNEAQKTILLIVNKYLESK